MSLIVPYVMHEAGSIPGVPGRFAAGQTVLVDVETFEIVRIEQAEAVEDGVPDADQEAAPPPPTGQDEQIVSGG